MIEDEMVKVKEECIMVAMVVPPVEGEEEGQVLEWQAGVCQKVNNTIIRYDLGFQ